MIDGFETITYELTDAERAILPVIVAGLKSKVGPARAVTGAHICATLNTRQGMPCRMTEARLRKIVNHIRIHDLIPQLLASSAGYYVADSIPDVQRYIHSLEQRIAAIAAVRDALRRQVLPGSPTPVQLELLK